MSKLIPNAMNRHIIGRQQQQNLCLYTVQNLLQDLLGPPLDFLEQQETLLIHGDGYSFLLTLEKERKLYGDYS